MTDVEKIKDLLEKGEITHEQAYECILGLYTIGCDFIKELINKESSVNKTLMNNLDLYKKINNREEYDKTFSQWNKSNLVLWDLKDILCRMGSEDLD